MTLYKLGDQLFDNLADYETAHRKRRVLSSFKLDEVSSVDEPAQDGARAVIIKSKREPLSKADVAAELRAIQTEIEHELSMARDGRVDPGNIRDLEKRLDELEKSVPFSSTSMQSPSFRPGDGRVNEHEVKGSDEELECQREQVRAAGRRLRGLSNDDEDDMSEPEDFDEAIERIQARDKTLNRTAAMRKARTLWPALLEKHRAAEADLSKFAHLDVQKRNTDAIAEFEKRVDDEQIKAKSIGRPISRVAALQRAADRLSRENPGAFEAYRRGLD